MSRGAARALHRCLRTFLVSLRVLALLAAAARAGEWTITLEEPTGIHRHEDEKGKVLSKNSLPGPIEFSADSSSQFPDIRFPAGQAGRYTLWATVADREGKVVSENSYGFGVE